MKFKSLAKIVMGNFSSPLFDNIIFKSQNLEDEIESRQNFSILCGGGQNEKGNLFAYQKGNRSLTVTFQRKKK